MELKKFAQQFAAGHPGIEAKHGAEGGHDIQWFDRTVYDTIFVNARPQSQQPRSARKRVPCAVVLEPVSADAAIRIAAEIRQDE
jgi:hypothetical protein